MSCTDRLSCELGSKCSYKFTCNVDWCNNTVKPTVYDISLNGVSQFNTQ